MLSGHRRVALVGLFLAVAACSAASGDADKSGSNVTGKAKDNANASGSTGSSNMLGGRSFPLVTPPVKAAAPLALRGGSFAQTGGFVATDAPTISATDVKSRFFDAGPTNVYGILGAIDQRISELANGGATHPCLDQEPVAFTVTPFGHSVTMYAQCYELMGGSAGDPGLVQFGQKDGITYYYAAMGPAWTAAVLTPTTHATSGDAGADASADGGDDAGADAAATSYTVHAWSGVGYNNATSCGDKSAYDGCSYGAIELQADPSTHTFEIAVAGIGFGYCGAQLQSDGTSVFATGSIDMGTCTSVGTVCVAASDLTSAGTCDGLENFAIPPMGRTSSRGPHSGGPGNDAGPDGMWSPSRYPGDSADTITLDGTSTDSLHFGPTEPTAGATKF